MKDCEILFKPKVGVKGRYSIDKVDINGHRRHVTAFDNLITNFGLNNLFYENNGYPGFFQWLDVGSGTTTPAFTDVSLATLLFGNMLESMVIKPKGAPNYEIDYIFTYNIQNISQNSATIREVGLGLNVNGKCSRALVTNDAGTPMGIPLASGEWLIITYTFTLYPPLNDSVSTLTFGGTTYTFTARPWGLGPGKYWGEPRRLLKKPNAKDQLLGALITNTEVWYDDKPLVPMTQGYQENDVRIYGNYTGQIPPYVQNSYVRHHYLSFSPRNYDIAKFIVSFYSNYYNDVPGLRRTMAFQIGVDPIVPKGPSRSVFFTFDLAWARA